MSNTDRIGQIATVSGRLMNVLETSPGDIHIEDIAQALSLRCRYNCQIPYHYSVAQHCALGSLTLRKDKGSREFDDPSFARAWLLHDAAEAYLPDVPRHVKPALPGFQEIEDRLLAVIYERFGVGEFDQERLRELDNRMLQTEIRDLQPKWPAEVMPYGEPFGFKIIPYMATYSRRAFLMEFALLFPDEKYDRVAIS